MSEPAPANGSYVTWRELNLAIDPMKDQLKDISVSLRDLTAFMVGAGAANAERQKLRANTHFWVTVAATVFAAVFGGLVGSLAWIAWG